MLNLVQTEFLKLRRKKMVWFMLLATFIMPFFSFVYFNYYDARGIDPVAFYKLVRLWIVPPLLFFPFVLGVFCTVLMHDENRYDMLKQLWIVPVSKMGYFFSKFIVVLVYSIVFMLISMPWLRFYSASFAWICCFWMAECWVFGRKVFGDRCVDRFCCYAGFSHCRRQAKGYIFPVCMTLLYVFLGFFITSISMLPASCVQYFRYHCKRREYSGTCFC